MSLVGTLFEAIPLGHPLSHPLDVLLGLTQWAPDRIVERAVLLRTGAARGSWGHEEKLRGKSKSKWDQIGSLRHSKLKMQLLSSHVAKMTAQQDPGYVRKHAPKPQVSEVGWDDGQGQENLSVRL